MKMLTSLALLLIIQFYMPTTQADTYPNCTNSPTFTQNSPYDINLHDLLATLANQASSTGFQNYSVGETPNQVYGVYLCRGDATPSECNACVQEAHSIILQNCSHRVWGVIWYEYCMLRYSNVSFFHKMDTDPKWIIGNNQRNVSSNVYKVFLESLNNTSNVLVTKVADSTDKFATNVGNITGTTEQLFILGQCTPDLAGDECMRCLKVAIPQFPIPMYGGRVWLPSCNIRFEFNQFYMSDIPKMSFVPRSIGKSPKDNVVVGAPEPTPPPPPSKKILAIAVSVSAVIATLLVVGAYFYICRGRRTRSHASSDFITAESLTFELGTLQAATNNFSDDRKLGGGGFGNVYKGTLSNGQEIAVKRLTRFSDHGLEAFKNEAILIAKLQHKNLVRLLGFCSAREERLLVYEFVPNKSLDYLLFDPRKQRELDWPTRYNIILGTARGLLYLHEDSRPRIIHRDLKTPNILLEADMNPKISDFGLARIFKFEQAENATSVIAGTYGYMAPEYAMHGHFSIKSDAYSFGVLLLEIVSGKKISSRSPLFGEGDLLTCAWGSWNDGKPFEILDPTLGDSYSREEVLRCIHLGLLCVQENSHQRPTMSTIIFMLNIESTTSTLPKPDCPRSFYSSYTDSSSQATTSYTHSQDPTSHTHNELTISDMDPR